MKIYDVSMTVSPSMTVYKNKAAKRPRLDVMANFQTDGVYETALWMNLHTGTHMDFPKHMLEDGKTSESLDLTTLIREVKVVDLTHLDVSIKLKDIQDLGIKANDFILFKTQNSTQEALDFNFVYLEAEAAFYLKNQGITGVGIDALGIERDQKGHPTHHHLLESDIIIIEGLRLKDVAMGHYQMIALPLKIDGVEALPLRVILMEV